MDGREQVKTDLKVALREVVKALTVHPFFATIETCFQGETDGPVYGPDGKWTAGRFPVRIPFVKRSANGELKVPQDLYTTITGVCAEHGVGDVLGRWQEQVWDDATLERSREHEAQTPQEHVVYFRCTRWRVDAFFYEYARGLDEWRFDEDMFERLYQEYDAFLGDGEYLWRLVVPLRCLDGDVGEVVLDEQTSLGRLAPDEAASWQPFIWHDLDAFCEDLNYYFGSRRVLRIQAPARWHGGPYDPQAVLGSIERFTTACRLLKQPGVPRWHHWLELRSRFGVGGTCLDQDAWTRPRRRGQALGWARFDTEGLRDQTALHLTQDLVPDLLRLWRQLGASEGGELAMAVRRFDGLGDRRQVEDKLIDMALLLESTLLAGVRDELRFRLALRGARLLSGQRSPMQTFSTLKRLYDVRSKVVHGSAPDLASAINREDRSQGQRDAEALVAEVRDICADVLLALLDLPPGKSVQGRMQELDREAIEGLPPGPVSTDGA